MAMARWANGEGEDRYLDLYMEDRMGAYYDGDDALDPYAYGPDEEDEDEEEDTPESVTGAARWLCQTCYENEFPERYIPDEMDAGECDECGDDPVLTYPVEA